jgi:hypothetical protein
MRRNHSVSNEEVTTIAIIANAMNVTSVELKNLVI